MQNVALPFVAILKDDDQQMAAGGPVNTESLERNKKYANDQLLKLLYKMKEMNQYKKIGK